MENFLNRYRSITVLLLVIFAQLVLLAVQMKSDQDVRFIRLWTVTAVTPVARVLEAVRSGSIGLVRNYILLRQANADNRRLQADLDRLKVENIFLKNELNLADRAKALQVFQDRTPSKSLAASVIGTGAGSSSKVVFVDRGSTSGVERGMAVVTPEGIVGKVIAAYPTASEVLLITDPDFAAGVVSQKHQTHGTLKGQGTPVCKLDYVPAEDKLEPGEWLYTSGDDRVFPRGFPVGVVKAVHPGQPFQEINVEPSGLQRGGEDVLILIEGVHQGIPGDAAGQPAGLYRRAAAGLVRRCRRARAASGPRWHRCRQAARPVQGHRRRPGAQIRRRLAGIEASRFQLESSRGRRPSSRTGRAARHARAGSRPSPREAIAAARALRQPAGGVGAGQTPPGQQLQPEEGRRLSPLFRGAK